jgi:nicotinate-nucleotide pyrophosphorylase (carboxylating)
MKYQSFIIAALAEDIGTGDHSTLAAIDANAKGKAILKIKEAGILAGMEIAEEIFQYTIQRIPKGWRCYSSR